MAAPVLTAALVLSVAQVESWLSGRAIDSMQTQASDNFGRFKSLALAQGQLGDARASVYRTVALMASLDDAKVQAFRADLKGRLQALDKDLSAMGQGDATLTATLTEASRHLKGYVEKADVDIDLATVDANTGIAALQGADERFKQLSASVTTLVAQFEAHSKAEAAAASAQASRLHALLGMLALGAAAGAVFLGWRVLRRAMLDLARAGDAADATSQANQLANSAASVAKRGGAVVAQVVSTMDEINASSKRIGDIIGEISAAAAEQSSGIGQVNGAVTELDRMTQQNAALVEQSAAAAESLRDQADKLGSVVDAFQLERA